MQIPRMSSQLLLVVRLLLVGVVAAAVMVAIVLGREGDKSGRRLAATYSCPMHPEVRAAAPGDCPICGMVLEVKGLSRDPVAGAEDADSANGGATVTGSANPPGRVVLPPGRALRRYDATALARPYITALEMRVPAWIESADTGVALLHADEVELLKPKEAGTFELAMRAKDGPPPGVAVHLMGEAARWDRATSLVLFRIDGGAPAGVHLNQTGSLKLATRLRNGLAIPSSAVRQSPDGPYVFVVADDRRTLTRRAIVIGNVIYGLATIISGLGQGERVAALDTLFLEAEARLAGGNAP